MDPLGHMKRTRVAITPSSVRTANSPSPRWHMEAPESGGYPEFRRTVQNGCLIWPRRWWDDGWMKPAVVSSSAQGSCSKYYSRSRPPPLTQPAFTQNGQNGFCLTGATRRWPAPSPPSHEVRRELD